MLKIKVKMIIVNENIQFSPIFAGKRGEMLIICKYFFSKTFVRASIRDFVL